MNITIVGWYGTETLGDRSILLGILKIISYLYSGSKVYLGSLYPFFTERSIYEDQAFIKMLAPDIELSIFDVCNNKALKNCLDSSKICIMGGGPLMDLTELDHIYKIFKYSQRNGIRTILLGCGVGPVTKKEHAKKITEIIKQTDLIIFRDNLSKKKADEICQSFNYNLGLKRVVVNFDPAIIPPLYYKKHHANIEKTNKVVINLRKYPFTNDENIVLDITNKIIMMIKSISDEGHPVELLPNHTFFIGGDDRQYFSDIWMGLKDDNVQVQYKPLSLLETFDHIASSRYCLGMRYHAILFQTIINGNNYIIDYTDPKEGKIVGFLEMINSNTFYKSRYYNILNCPSTIPFFNAKFIHNLDYDKIVDDYANILK